MGWNELGWNELKNTDEEKQEEVIFKPLKEVRKGRGLKIGIYGDYATGKTHFALTCPEPIYILDTENGVVPLAHNFEGKDIKVLDILEEDGSKSFNKIEKAINYIMTQEQKGTVIIDSVSDLWDFAQENAKVKVFKLNPMDRLKQQWDWGVINKMYLGIIQRLVNSDFNIILTAREGEIYAGAGQPTNMVKPKWQKSTGFWVDYVIHNTKKIDKMGNINFYSSIEKSRSLKDIMGKVFPNLDYKTFINHINKLKGGKNGNKE